MKYRHETNRQRIKLLQSHSGLARGLRDRSGRGNGHQLFSVVQKPGKGL